MDEYTYEMDELCFEEVGFVSLWVGQSLVEDGSDFLRDQYRVDFADADFQECTIREQALPLAELLVAISWSESFREAALAGAQQAGLTAGRWLMAQFDFKYDPAVAELREMPRDPVFIGAFEFSKKPA
ncbi:hypothetical protein [Anatilimnocola floriformis]|uniref:hypothetical protein n=1 Tax=Anatilimnocola floriformis TaxID=2948575 RepID=UPI0020C3A2B6|nr:hypothetical protein [Anatilimnocola floriformis]